MFMKDLSEVALEDINHLIQELRLKESDRIEYKSTLPTNGKDADPWINGFDKIGPKAIEKLTAEIIAFANYNGGTLILGIEENDEKPPRPKSMLPLTNVHALEQRLCQAITSCIEPPLPSLQSRCIETDATGSGIIIFHTERSDMAPHRSIKDNECYIRRQDRCEKMTMPEIQNLVKRRERQKIEGLWTAKFGIPGKFINAGIVVLENGKIFGGDSQYIYTGIYELNDQDQIVANLSIEHYHGDAYTAFDTFEKRFNVSLFGKFQSNAISGQITKLSAPQAQISLYLERKNGLI